MAEFRKNTNITRADAIGGMIKSVKSMTDSSTLTQFVENAQPMKSYWYHIDQEHSVKGKGFNDTAGPYDGGIKYILIKDYVCYGYQDERPVDVEKGEHLDIRWKLDSLTFFHRPGTLRPLVGDRMSLDIEEHKYLYKVTESVPVNWNNKPFIRTTVTKCEVKNADYYWQDFKRDNLLTRILEYDAEIAVYGSGVGIGNGTPADGATKASPFVEAGSKELIEKLKYLKDEIMQEYISYFYIESKNSFMSPDKLHRGMLTYTPLLVDLQMEFRPLWEYGINMILTYEVLVSKRSLYKYKRHNVRKFLLRKVEAWSEIKSKGIHFSGYQYLQSYYSPTFKVESYLNDSKQYYIYDYLNGESIITEDENLNELKMELRDIVKVPEKYHTLFESYVTEKLDPEWLVKWLETFEFEISFTEMVMVFLVLAIIDSTIYKLTKGSFVQI